MPSALHQQTWLAISMVGLFILVFMYIQQWKRLDELESLMIDMQAQAALKTRLPEAAAPTPTVTTTTTATISPTTAATTATTTTASTTTQKTTPSYFERVAALAQTEFQQSLPSSTDNRPTFDLTSWTHRSDGGLTDQDRLLLGRLYHAAHSVMEFGLGESTAIAHAVQVPRYTGIDNDATWVAQARDKAADRFRFYFADVGPTGVWGYPNRPELVKGWIQYQFQPLWSETAGAFDVYTIDGRWRVPTLLLCVLHASHHSNQTQNQKGNGQSRFLLHDCPKKGVTPDLMYRQRFRKPYARVTEVMDLVDHSGEALCVYQRKAGVTDADIFALWQEMKSDFS